MASLPINRLPHGVEMPESPEKARSINRRKRTRAQLHWPLSFPLTGTTETVQTTTQDLSSDGFYCVANGRFVPGEARHCTLLVPTHRPGGENSPLQVLCKVRIIRVEVTGERGFYGVGCQIIDYRLANSGRGMELQGALADAGAVESRLNVSNRDL
jgi:PilZ domain